MSSKSVTAVPKKKWKLKNFLKMRYGASQKKKSEKPKNVLKTRYNRSKKKGKLKNVHKKYYDP